MANGIHGTKTRLDDLEMEVRTRAPTGASHTGDGSALTDVLSLLDQKGAVVGVAGLAAIGMGKLDQVAIAA